MFVLEPAERTIYTRPPRNSRHDLFDLKMMKGIALSGLSLFIAVMVPYFYALHIGVPQQTAQTLAFSAWMVGQMTLAFVMRSNYEPLSRLGPFSNPALDVMLVSVAAFLLVALGLPVVGPFIKLAPVEPLQFAAVAVFALVLIFWQEIVKAWRYRKTGSY
jgi:P-type Ca2+ transporter type 2C